MTDSMNPLREGMPAERTADPVALVIFGASGDLTKRKLVPAVYNLALSRLLPGEFAVVGVARRPKPDFADEMREQVSRFSRRKPVNEATWSELAKGMRYVQGDFSDDATYARLKGELEALDVERGTRKNRLFYMSVGPDEAPKIVEKLRKHELVVPPVDAPDAPQQRVIVEKPFGHDLKSAEELNKVLLTHLDEKQIYRIDHYLGKETVQNLLVFRFGNTLFEPLWSQRHVDHVQITVAEDIGVEGRGKFYEKVGITRDIVQNHALQILTLVAMEPPASWGADAVRDEKVKVLRSIRPIVSERDLVKARDKAKTALLRDTVRARYASGIVRGDRVPGYLQEPDVAADSKTETYVAMRIQLDSWRWGGVPFYLRAGKRLAKRVAEVALHFKPLPHRLFKDDAQGPGYDEPNSLILRIQPDEGISLRFATKVPGQGNTLRDVAMDFRYGAAFGSSTPEAYERLMLDAMRGDATLFTRADEVEAQWRFIDPILRGWSELEQPVEEYAAGSWGPKASDELVARATPSDASQGRAWRRP